MGAFFLVILLSLSGTVGFAGTSKQAPTYQHIFIVILENSNANDATQQPFIHQLIQEGAYLTNFHAVSHPSQPNYIALIAGDTLGVDSDNTQTIDSQQIGDLLEAHNKTWKSYAENYPGNCFTDSSSDDGLYMRKHEPFISFAAIQNDPARCNSHIVDASTLQNDILSGQLPNFSLFVPNMDDDGHDTDVTTADAWLAKTFGPLLANPQFMNSTLFIVTFDENDEFNDTDNNRVATILVGPGIQAGSTSDSQYTHYSLLRFVEDNFQLGSLHKNDLTATPLNGIWTANNPSVNICRSQW